MLVYLLLLLGGPPALLTATVVLARSILVVVTVENQSMSPTLEPGDRVLVLRRFSRHPNQGDIVVVWPWDIPPTGPTPFGVREPFIKRVIGLPGQTLVTSITELDATNRARELAAHDNSGRRVWHIPLGHYFVRSDQPIGGFDSLSWGPVPVRGILGVVVMKLPRRVNQDLP